MPPTNRTEIRRSSSHLRWGWLLLAWACIVLALIGALVPGVPTTVFVLIAGWAASRCSPRLHQWLRSHSLLGPCLRNWEQGGHIDRRTKWTASAGMLFALILMLFSVQHPLWLSACLALIAIGALAVWSRPEPAAVSAGRHKKPRRNGV